MQDFVALTDCFDFYLCKAWPVDVAFKAIEEDSGSHFDPNVVSAFLSARREVESLIEHWNEIDVKRASEIAH